MRIAIVSDIHANFIALQAVLAAVGSIDGIWCVGDIIGYGPNPNECIAEMKFADYAICGNHDLACIGKIDLLDFNPDARAANEWNGKQLNPENRLWLQGLRTRIEQLDTQPDFALAHGSPRDPVWEYLLSEDQALANFADEHFRTRICLIGHSHIPVYFRLDAPDRCKRILPDRGSTIDLANDTRFIINPGSVGQPRNQDPRAAYALLDLDAGTVQFQRVDYDYKQTQEQMRKIGLPAGLIRRLAFGL